MRPEKSKLLKISLCVLSCVFFGCGDNKPKSNGTTKVLTRDTIKQQLENNTHGKNAQQENSPFMKILSNAMTKVLGNKDNDAVKILEKYIKADGSINADFAAALEDPESAESKDFISALENVITAINTEVEKSLENYDLTASFGVTEDAINEWKEKGLKNKDVAKVISTWQVIYSEFSKFNENPLKFLIKSGKGFMHRSTIKAIDLAWRSFVKFLAKGCERCESALNAFLEKNNEVAEEAKNVRNAICEGLTSTKEFVKDQNFIRTKTLEKVYSLIGDKFLPGYGEALFTLINCKDSSSEDADFKVTTDWGNAVFSHFYLGVKSDRASFSNPACAFGGDTMSGLKKKGYEAGFSKYSAKYEELLKEFVRFAITEKIIDDKFFSADSVDAICGYLECYKEDNKSVNKGRKDISLSPWLMLCAKNNWDKIQAIVKFNKGTENSKNVWTVEFQDGIEKIEDLIKADENYDKLEVYAGILALCNLCYGLRHYEDGKSDKGKGEGFHLSTGLQNLANNSDLKKYALKGRLKQWDDFKTAAEKGTLRDEEENNAEKNKKSKKKVKKGKK